MLVKGIRGVPMPVEGKTKLLLTFRTLPTVQMQHAQFMLVKLPLLYNSILRRPILYDFEVASNIRYSCMTN